MGAASSCLRDGFGPAFLQSLKNNGNIKPGEQYERHGHEEQVLFFPDENQPCRDFLKGNCHRSNCKYSHDASSPFPQLLAHLSSAQRSLDIAVFTITHNLIRDVLLERHRQGVRIRIVTDDTQRDRLLQQFHISVQSEAKGSDVQELVRAGIKAVHDDSAYHMHHKFCIVDGRKLLNGSLNWTVQGVKSNQENVMVTTNLAFVKPFQARFDVMWAQFSSNLLK